MIVVRARYIQLFVGFLGIRYTGSPGKNSFPERARVRGKLRILEPSLESSGYVHSARDHERWRVFFLLLIGAQLC